MYYNPDGQLVKIELPPNMPPDVALSIKNRIPYCSDQLAHRFAGTSAIIVEADIEVTFAMFWHDYPNKRNRHLAADYWLKMSKTQQVQAYVAVKEYRRYCDRNKHWYNPRIADVWLKKKEYLNEWNAL
mgnify:FL=1